MDQSTKSFHNKQTTLPRLPSQVNCKFHTDKAFLSDSQDCQNIYRFQKYNYGKTNTQASLKNIDKEVFRPQTKHLIPRLHETIQFQDKTIEVDAFYMNYKAPLKTLTSKSGIKFVGETTLENPLFRNFQSINDFPMIQQDKFLLIGRQIMSNRERLLQAIMMLSPEINGDKLINFPCYYSRRDVNNIFPMGKKKQFCIEVTRLNKILNLMNILIEDAQLSRMIQQSNSLFIDDEFGEIVDYYNFFDVLNRALQEKVLHEKLLTASIFQQGTVQNLSEFKLKSEQQRVQSRSYLRSRITTLKNSHYCRVGFNVANLSQHEIQYDSHQDLSKSLKASLKVSQYQFMGIEYGYYELSESDDFKDFDCDLSEEIKVFRNINSNFIVPLWIRAIYAHKYQTDQILAMKKNYFYFQNDHQEQKNDISHKPYSQSLLLTPFSVNYLTQEFYNESIQTSLTYYVIQEQFKTLKVENQLTNNNEQWIKMFMTSDQECNQIAKIDTVEYEITSDVSDLEESLDIMLEMEHPLIVKKIQSYPVFTSTELISRVMLNVYKFSHRKILPENVLYVIQPQLILKKPFSFNESFDVKVQYTQIKNENRIYQIQGETMESSEDSFDFDEEEELPIVALQVDKQNHTPQQILAQIKTNNKQENVQIGKQYQMISFYEEYFTKSLMIQKFFNHYMYKDDVLRDRICQDDQFQYKLHIQTLKLPQCLFDAQINFNQIQQKFLSVKGFQIAEEDEDPSFDEEPIQLEIPESNPFQVQQSYTDLQSSKNIIQIIMDHHAKSQFIDLQSDEGAHSIHIYSKFDYVSSIEFSIFFKNFYLKENSEQQLLSKIKQYNSETRQFQPQLVKIDRENFHLKSLIVNYEKKGNKNFLTSFGFLAKKKKPDLIMDEKQPSQSQYIESHRPKNITNETQMRSTVYEGIYQDFKIPYIISYEFLQTEVILNIFYANSPIFKQNEIAEIFYRKLEWFKNSMFKSFPRIKFIENSTGIQNDECFKVYLCGVGLEQARDHLGRTLVLKKTCPWLKFLQNFEKKMTHVYDTICLTVWLYGTPEKFEKAQQTYLKNLSKQNQNVQNQWKHIDQRLQKQ